MVVPQCESEIYDVLMKLARKLIHGGPVHHCYEPFGCATGVHGSAVRVKKALCVGVLKEIKKNRNKETL